MTQDELWSHRREVLALANTTNKAFPYRLIKKAFPYRLINASLVKCMSRGSEHLYPFPEHSSRPHSFNGSKHGGALKQSVGDKEQHLKNSMYPILLMHGSNPFGELLHLI